MHSYGSSLLEWFFHLHGTRRCMWTCFLCLVCINSTREYVLNQLRQATTKSCQGRRTHVQLLTAMRYAHLGVIPQPGMVPGSTWIQQDFFYVHCLSAITWLLLLKKRKKKPKPTCNIFALSYWHCCVFCINCQFHLTF